MSSLLDPRGSDAADDTPDRRRIGDLERQRALQTLQARLEAQRAERAVRPLAVGDLVRRRTTWGLGIVAELVPTWCQTVYVVAWESPRGTTETRHSRREIVPED